MICRDDLVWAAGQTTPTNGLEPPLQTLYAVGPGGKRRGQQGEASLALTRQLAVAATKGASYRGRTGVASMPWLALKFQWPWLYRRHCTGDGVAPRCRQRPARHEPTSLTRTERSGDIQPRALAAHCACSADICGTALRFTLLSRVARWHPSFLGWHQGKRWRFFFLTERWRFGHERKESSE